MNFYAIGFKGWVEVRKARIRPKRHVTTVVHKGTREEMVPGSGRFVASQWTWETRTVPTRVTLKSIFHEGGQVVTSFPAHKFALNVKTGCCKKLNADELIVLKRICGGTLP